MQVAQFADGILAQGGAQPQDLDLGLGLLRLELCLAGQQLAPHAREPRRFTLQRQHPARLGEALVQQRLLVLQLATDQFELAVDRVDLRDGTVDLPLDLDDPLAQLAGLLGGGFGPGVEQLALAGDLVRDLRLDLGDRQQFWGEIHRVVAVALGPQPGLARHDLVKLALDDRQLRQQQRVVEAQHHVARLHLVAVLDKDFADHAPLGVLHGLPVALDLDHAHGDDGARQLRKHRPAADAQHQHRKREQPYRQRATRAPGLRRIIAHVCRPSAPIVPAT